MNLNFDEKLDEKLDSRTTGSAKDYVIKTVNTTTSTKRMRLYLVGMFVLCYFSWVAVHAQREFWAMSKKTIKQDVPSLSNSFFGTIDTGLFLTYAVCQFATGVIGDSFNKRHVLAVSYVIQSGLFMLFGLAGFSAYNRSTFDGQ